MLARGSPLGRLLALVAVLALMMMAQIGSAIASAPLEVALLSVETVQPAAPVPLVDLAVDFPAIAYEHATIATVPALQLSVDVATAAPLGHSMRTARGVRPSQRDAFLIVNQSTGARSRT